MDLFSQQKTGWTVPLASATPVRDESALKSKHISFLSQWLCHQGWHVWLRYVLPFSYTGICNIVLFLLDLVTLACCRGMFLFFYQSSTVWISSEKLRPSATGGTEVIHSKKNFIQSCSYSLTLARQVESSLRRKRMQPSGRAQMREKN